MHRLGLFAILGAVLGLASVSSASPRPQRVQSLGSAIASGRVRAVIMGTGASRGDSVKLIVAKTAKARAGPLRMTVAPGTMLQSTVDGYQNMIVAFVRGRHLGGRRYAPSSHIVVSGARQVTYILSAYCTDPEKKDATPSVRFALAKTDPVLRCIVERGRGLPISGMQTAVWRHTGNVDFETVNERLEVDEFDWGQALAVVDTCSRGR